ncbi:uncharacterized protein LOC112847526 [Oreochromis niloticus]|uniref:uncharacterized protein LOC112847526 n=1 Tax=Oreochromis niloticus TaxID=8128 RepID=UPI000DF2B992|nr:uncharacterized protein LOC112847526 [Oreochromis niloticus]
MASLPSEGSPPLSIRHGARVVAPQQYTVEQVLLAVGEQVGHENITYGSRMNKAVERAVDAGTGERPARSGADEQPSTSSAVIGEPLAAQGDRMEVAASAPQAALEEQGVVQATNEVEDGCDDIQDRESVEDNQDSGQTKATASEVGVASVISGSLSAENEEDDLLEDDSLSQCSDVVSQDDHQQLYSLEDINRFLDETFGMQSVEVTEFFPDVDLFIKSVLKIRRVVDYEQLSKQKRFRLKKILTKLRREKRGKTPSKAL